LRGVTPTRRPPCWRALRASAFSRIL
jgi:hypothetical protein